MVWAGETYKTQFSYKIQMSATKIPSLKELQAEYQALHPSVEFVIQPELGVPYPQDKDAPMTHYWGWISFVQGR